MIEDFAIIPATKIKIRFFNQLMKAVLDQQKIDPFIAPMVVPFFLLIEFLQRFPQFIPDVKNLLAAHKLLILPRFAQIDPYLASFESQIQNKIMKLKSLEFLSDLSSTDLDISNFPLAEAALENGSTQTEGIFSARVGLKQLNQKCQQLLERYLAPLNAILPRVSNAASQNILDVLWSDLLKIQSRALLSGCCADVVAAEGAALFSQTCHGIQALIEELATTLSTGEKIESGCFIIFNPSPIPRSEMVHIPMPSGKDDPTTLQALSGETEWLPVQMVNRRHVKNPGQETDSSAEPNPMLLTQVKIPAFGFKSIQIKSNTTPNSLTSALKCGHYFLENDLVRLTVKNNGSLELWDKTQNQIYERLNIFEDSGDAGTTAFFLAPVENSVCHSTKFEPRISLVEEGPLRGAIRVRYRMKIPDGLNPEKSGRSEKMEVLRIWTTIYLLHDSPVVFFETQIINHVGQHRLRVRFETGCNPRHSQTFVKHRLTMMEHPGSPTSTFGSEGDTDWPLIHWASVSNEDSPRGLSLFTYGLHGYQLRLDTPRTLLLTLLRSVDTCTRVSSQNEIHENLPAPAAQCLGEHNFYYALLPHAGDENATLKVQINAFEQFLAPAAIFPGRLNSDFHLDQNLIEVNPATLLFSCLRQGKSEDEIVLRVKNPSEKSIQGEIKIVWPLRAAFRAEAKEQLLEEIALDSPHKVELTIPSKAIETIKLIPEKK